MPDDPGESSLIATLLQGRPQPPPLALEVEAGDDAAVLPGGLVVSADAMVEGVHWDDRLSPADVGWKLVASNVSDLAAMGARPTWCTLTVGLPRPVDAAWLSDFAMGLHAACARWSLHLVGGDLTRSPGPRCLSLTIGGHAAGPVTRSGARAGDELWVTGTLGDAADGFTHGGPGLRSLRRPQPPLELGVALAEQGLVNAMMDLSDGLATDLPRLCAASRLGAVVQAAALPASPTVADRADRLALQVAFGEDYGLLFAASPVQGLAIEGLAAFHGVRVTRIGALRADGPVLLEPGPWPAPAFAHFAAPPEAPA